MVLLLPLVVPSIVACIGAKEADSVDPGMLGTRGRKIGGGLGGDQSSIR
jgi:hypothetical protein